MCLVCKTKYSVEARWVSFEIKVYVRLECLESLPINLVFCKHAARLTPVQPY